MFSWSKELLIEGCVFLPLISWWHILYCQTTKAPPHANVEQLFICLIRRADSMLMLKLNIEPALFIHSCLSGVFSGIFVLQHLVFCHQQLDLQCSANRRQLVINKHHCLIKGRQGNAVIFHWLTAFWIFNGILYGCFQ